MPHLSNEGGHGGETAIAHDHRRDDFQLSNMITGKMYLSGVSMMKGSVLRFQLRAGFWSQTERICASGSEAASEVEMQSVRLPAVWPLAG